MVSQKDIYTSAQLLIKQHGKKAEDVATRRMEELMDKDDAKGAGVWLAIASAITDLQNLKQQQGKLH
jgi:hypothetical protein